MVCFGKEHAHFVDRLGMAASLLASSVGISGMSLSDDLFGTLDYK